MGKQRLNWFLMKSGIDPDTPSTVIEPPDNGELHQFRVPALNEDHDSLFVKSARPARPKWLGYVDEHIDDGDELPRMLSSLGSAVLFVRAGKRLLAVTFGHGRFLLRPDCLVQDFGLKVVLNSVDPSQIKSVDARTFDELTVHTRRGVSRDSPFAAFELDVTRNLLRGITGKSSTDGLEGTLTGAASLAMHTNVQLPDLPALADKVVRAYRAKRYKKHFGFVDHMKAERDPGVIARLDGQLLEALVARELTDMHLAIPEAVDWDAIDRVRFSLKRKEQPHMPDPKISVYRGLRDADDLTVTRLKSDRVEALSAADDNRLHGRWRVYDCLVFETEHDGRLFVLSGGDWYSITKSHRDKVEAFARALPELDVDLPPAAPDDDEPAYNATAGPSVGGLTLDGKAIGVGGVDRAELCDILMKDGTFVHVKMRGRSSTLSHLFAQGLVSARLLLNDDGFRADAAKLVSSVDRSFASAVPKKTGARDQIKVAYVVISRRKRANDTRPFGLPFFSLVSLQAAAQTLRDSGIDVRVKEIKQRS